MDLEEHLRVFMSEVSTGNIEIYNEFSTQFELAIYLRTVLPHD